jgi:hypothetical protein
MVTVITSFLDIFGDFPLTILALNCPMVIISPPNLLDSIIAERPAEFPTQFIVSSDIEEVVEEQDIIRENTFSSDYFVRISPLSVDKWGTFDPSRPWPDMKKIISYEKNVILDVDAMTLSEPFGINIIGSLKDINRDGLTRLGYLVGLGNVRGNTEYTIVLDEPHVSIKTLGISAVELRERLIRDRVEVLVAGHDMKSDQMEDYFLEHLRESPLAYPYESLFVGKTEKVYELMALLSRGYTIARIMREHLMVLQIDYHQMVFSQNVQNKNIGAFGIMEHTTSTMSDGTQTSIIMYGTMIIGIILLLVIFVTFIRYMLQRRSKPSYVLPPDSPHTY